MFLAYLIYTILLLLFYFSYRNLKQTLWITLLPIIIYSIIIGLRFNVGIDYQSYYKAYLNPYLLNPEVFEMGYIYLNKILQYCNFPVWSLFMICAYIQIYGIYFLVKDDEQKKFNLAFVFYLLTLNMFFALNGVRQATAIGFIFIAIKYLYERKFYIFLFWIFIALSFHKSAIIFIPLYFIINKFQIKLKLSLILYWSCFLLSSVALNFLSENYSLLATLTGYSDRADNLSGLEIDWSETGYKLGQYLWLALDSIIIWCYYKFKLNKTVVFFAHAADSITDKSNFIIKNDNKLRIIYNLYFIGICFSTLVSGTYFDRVAQYFIVFRIFVYAYIYNYVFNFSRDKYTFVFKIILAFFAIILIAFYYNAIYKHAGMCSPFQFIE